MQDKIDIIPLREEDRPKRLSRHNLPARLTPLIGREQEVQSVCALLQRPEVRLLALIGPGGVGKTRLGVQIATNMLDDFVDGITFVSLAPINDPDLIIPTIAEAFNPALEDASLERLKTFLQGRQFLLLLDNFEQVVSAAPLVVDLLTSCPEVKVLITSRMVLHVHGEYDFFVPPLALHDLTQLSGIENIARYPAVALFLQRAQAIESNFQRTRANARTIAEICTRLDGLPLALELAATRLNLLSPQALLARLEHRLTILTSKIRDVPARQQTLHNTIAWSYSLLTEEEQRLFRRLSVFVGGFTLEAAEAVSIALGEVNANVLDVAESLLGKSLLQRAGQVGDEPRLMMLETIREFGLECLAASGEIETTQQVHAAYYLSLLEQSWRNTSLAEQWGWHSRLEQEYVNLRAALRWSVEQGGHVGTETVLRLSLVLLQFWLMSGRVSEGRRWLKLALAVGEESVALERARGFLAAGRLALTQADYDLAETLLKQSQALYKKLADSVGVGTTIQKLGQVALSRGNYTLAQSLSEEALAYFREANDRRGGDGLSVTSEIEVGNKKYLMLVRALALDNLVRVAVVQGEYAKARSLAEECLTLSRKSDDRRNIANSLFHLALLAFSEGDQAVARLYGQECLTVSREVRYQWSLACSLGLLGLVALHQGDEAATHLLLAESRKVRRQVEDRSSIQWGIYCLGWIVFQRWDSAVAYAMYTKLLSILQQLDDTEFLVTCLEGLGSMVAARELVEGPKGKSRMGKLPSEDRTCWAARLWAAAEALREASGVPLSPHRGCMNKRTVAAVNAQLGEEVFAAAWAEGRSMRPEGAIAALQQAEMLQQVLIPKPSSTYPAGLTAREVEVLRLVAQGLTDAQVAEQLIVSYRTVTTHMSSIYNKLGISSRAAATRFAVEHQLI